MQPYVASLSVSSWLAAERQKAKQHQLFKRKVEIVALISAGLRAKTFRWTRSTSVSGHYSSVPSKFADASMWFVADSIIQFMNSVTVFYLRKMTILMTAKMVKKKFSL